MKTISQPLEILHIEDNANDAFFFKTNLDSIPINIGKFVRTKTLSEALFELHQGLTPDLVFLDLSLPDAYELEGLKTLMADMPHLIVIVLTGNENLETPLKALQAGAQDYLSKNEMKREILARVIRFALYRSDSQRMMVAAIEEAKRANQAKSQFLANIGHEIRTPLNAIMGYTEIFKSEVKGLASKDHKDMLEDLNTLSKAEEDLLDLLNDLVDMAKIESNQFRLEPTIFSPLQVVESATQLFRDSFQKNDNTFSCHIEEGVPELILSDPKRIRQIIINLLSNANKFTHNGQISLKLDCRPSTHPEEDAYELIIAIQDSGIGISDEHQELIFEYFQQVDNSNERQYNGSGLGLTICRQIAHMMGGDISVESRLGRGSTFTVKLRVTPAPYAEDSEEAEESNISSFLSSVRYQVNNCKALVVEDDHYSRKLITKTLSHIGMTVQAVPSAEAAALELVKGNAYDLIIVDVHLPGKDGLELINAIKREGNSLPKPMLIVATGDRSTIIRDRCKEEGVNAMLLKPFAPEALCREIAKTIT